MMVYITEEEVRKVVTTKMALAVFRKAYEECAKGRIYAGGRVMFPIRGEENTAQWLTANCLDAPIFGSKLSTTFPGNWERGLPVTVSQISLYSAETGKLIALLEANYLTAVKTGGSAAIATDLMARKDAGRLGVIGSGQQAFSQVQSIQEVRELTQVLVYDANPDRAKDFAERVEGIRNRPYAVAPAESADACVSASDIVCTCTTSHTPVFDGEALKPGTHVNAIGSYTPFMQEIDEKTVLRAARITSEHVDGLWEAAGDILIPFEKGLIARDKVTGSVGDVLTGKVAGRMDDNEITLYESVGSSVLDVSIAIATYNLLYPQS